MKHILEMANFRKLKSEEKEMIDKDINKALKSKEYKAVLKTGLIRSETPRQWTGRTISFSSPIIKSSNTTWMGPQKPSHNYDNLTFIIKVVYENDELFYRVHVTSGPGLRQMQSSKFIPRERIVNGQNYADHVKNEFSSLTDVFNNINRVYSKKIKDFNNFVKKVKNNISTLIKKEDSTFADINQAALDYGNANRDFTLSLNLNDKNLIKFIIEKIKKDPSEFKKLSDISKIMDPIVIKNIEKEFPYLKRAKSYNIFEKEL